MKTKYLKILCFDTQIKSSKKLNTQNHSIQSIKTKGTNLAINAAYNAEDKNKN